jgi:hypothetical protein
VGFFCRQKNLGIFGGFEALQITSQPSSVNALRPVEKSSLETGMLNCSLVDEEEKGGNCVTRRIPFPYAVDFFLSALALTRFACAFSLASPPSELTM